MKWIEVRITTTAEASDAICEMLTQAGAGGVVIQDPNDIRREISRPDSLDYADDNFLDSLGTDVNIMAYFDGEMNKENLKKLLMKNFTLYRNFWMSAKAFRACARLTMKTGQMPGGSITSPSVFQSAL